MKRILFLLFLVLFGCSQSRPDIELVKVNGTYVVNGEKSEFKDYSSIAAIVKTGSNKPFCTGTFIAEDLVMTAAHCVITMDSSELMVVYGYSDPTLISPDCFYPVVDIEVNDSYMGGYEDVGPYIEGDHDIALLLVDTSIFERGINFDGILSPGRYGEILAIGEWVTIAGYGQNIKGEQGGALYSGEVPVIWRGETEIAVGLGTEDVKNPTGACFGDSGGPIYVWVGGERVVTGITSRAMGLPACENGAIYTLPGVYFEWIRRKYEDMVYLQEMSGNMPAIDVEVVGMPICGAVETINYSDAGLSGIEEDDAGVVIGFDAGKKIGPIYIEGDAGVGKNSALGGCGCQAAGKTGAMDIFLVLMIIVGAIVGLRYCE